MSSPSPPIRDQSIGTRPQALASLLVVQVVATSHDHRQRQHHDHSVEAIAAATIIDHGQEQSRDTAVKHLKENQTDCAQRPEDAMAALW